MVNEGDASLCNKCKAYTVYKQTCAVCSIPNDENRKRYSGEINFLRQKYPVYCP